MEEIQERDMNEGSLLHVKYKDNLIQYCLNFSFSIEIFIMGEHVQQRLSCQALQLTSSNF